MKTFFEVTAKPVHQLDIRGEVCSIHISIIKRWESWHAKMFRDHSVKFPSENIQKRDKNACCLIASRIAE